ncbi:Mini-ribonuclease 3 [uncultured Lactobacillus sp.]|uniref:Mini-ribonuclease 3 n=1 Tax=uncultured Lactobacillus sp. TaxID=153152 RepID=UPI00263584C3|nr:ribonuclease III domain-containing protein [uncultured Lactobacillus sp.]
MLKPKVLKEEDKNPYTMAALTLAYLGDGVYEVYIRRHLVKGGIVKPQMLQRYATHYVSAKAQADLITKMEAKNMLSEDELDIFHRGRNAKSHTHAKNTSLATYRLSTGFEALIGYLDLLGKHDRVKEICEWCIKQVEQGENKDECK